MNKLPESVFHGIVAVVPRNEQVVESTSRGWLNRVDAAQGRFILRASSQVVRNRFTGCLCSTASLPVAWGMRQLSCVMARTRRYAVVTGGSGSLGSAITGILRADGWEVDAPGSAELDVRRVGEVRAYFSGRDPELLVCAAGLVRDAVLARLPEEAWDDVWSVNHAGARDCARAVIPGMVERGAGHVVFISSYSAISPPCGQAAYAAAKAALLGLTKDLACRHGASNVRVNAVLPGFLDTNMTAEISGARRDQVLADHQLGRFNTCEAVARFILNLHDHLPHTSGQVFQLDSRCSGGAMDSMHVP